RATDLDAFGPEILGGRERLLHGAAEGDPALQLDGDVFRDQLRIGFRRLDLDDVHVNLFAGHAAEFFLELVNFRAFAANDDARAGGHDGDAATAGGALDANLG